MSYRRALLTRWSRRDRMAVVVIAVTVAFLTGTTLVVLAVGSSTATIAAQYGVGAAVTEHASVADARAEAGPEAIVVPITTVETAESTATVVGVPVNASVGSTTLRSASGPTLGTVETESVRSLRGPDGTVELRVTGRGQGPFPPDWYVTAPETVETLGPTGALVVAPANDVPGRGVPLQGVLAFFIAGTRSALATLGVAAAIGATLVGVTIYSVTRMTVRDRLRELFVLRATGRTRWQVRRLFVARGLLLVGVGVALGYAMGVIVTNAAVSLAVAVGLPTSLATRVTGDALRFLLPTYGGVVLIGVVAALVAVQPEVAQPPGLIERTDATVSFDGVGPTLLSVRTVVPTVATLAAFVTFLLVVAGMASVAGPLATTDHATVTEPGSRHPIASKVPADYAEPLRDREIAASPEILLFLVSDGQPFPARGANYTAFETLSDATIVQGRRPTTSDEAVIGADLAETLGVSTGETLVLGGSVRPAVTRVTIVGTFEADGPDDDQLVVPLPTARHLSNVGKNQVNFIRAERLPDRPAKTRTVGVSDLGVPGRVAVGQPFQVTVTVRNDALNERTVARTVQFGDATKEIRVTVPPNSQRTATVRFVAASTGTRDVVVGDVRRSVTVVEPGAIRLVGVPSQAPPRSRPRVRVVDVAGASVAGATVTAGNWSGTTGSDGFVRVRLDSAETDRVMATTDDNRAIAHLEVSDGVGRELSASVTMAPSQPSLLVEPTATVSLSNPWAVPVNRTVVVEAPAGPYERSVSVAPGTTQRLDIPLPRRQPGTYDVRVRADGEVVAATSYRVTGDERIVSALATSGRSGTTGIGQAVQVALGNLELALGALILLGAGMTVGGSAATFVGAVHANQRTVGVFRAVGATRSQVGRLVLEDALRLGAGAVVGAVVLGVAALHVFEALGLLTVYGVAIATTPSGWLLGAVTVGSLLVVGLGAGVALVVLLRRPPAALLDGQSR